MQKRQILCTIYEAFLLFEDENPNIKIGFSKFSEARPMNIVLPGATGTHVVCVCSYHQNPKLMIAHSQIATRKEFKTILGRTHDDLYYGEIKHQHLVAQLMCNPPTVCCWQGDCKECEDSSNLSKQLEEIFKFLDVEIITYHQRESTDRTELVKRN